MSRGSATTPIKRRFCPFDKPAGLVQFFLCRGRIDDVWAGGRADINGHNVRPRACQRNGNGTANSARRARHDGRFAFETEVRRGSSVVRARFGRVSLFVAQQCRSCDGSCRCYDHFTSRDSSIALFWFPVCQRHVLTRKSFAFHMKLFRMMRQRHVSFFADALGRRSEWMPASDYSIRESALFRSVPKIFYPIVRSHDFPVLPGNDVAQRRGETIL